MLCKPLLRLASLMIWFPEGNMCGSIIPRSCNKSEADEIILLKRRGGEGVRQPTSAFRPGYVLGEKAYDGDGDTSKYNGG